MTMTNTRFECLKSKNLKHESILIATVVKPKRLISLRISFRLLRVRRTMITKVRWMKKLRDRHNVWNSIRLDRQRPFLHELQETELNRSKLVKMSMEQ